MIFPAKMFGRWGAKEGEQTDVTISRKDSISVPIIVELREVTGWGGNSYTLRAFQGKQYLWEGASSLSKWFSVGDDFISPSFSVPWDMW